MTVNSRVAIITGASQGIGAAIARRLAKDGLDLALADLEGAQPALAKLVAELNAGGGKAIAVTCDVRSKEDVDALVEKAAAELGRVDVMIANAGIAPVGPFLDVSVETMDNLHAVNVRGVFLCYQAAARQMIKQGGGGKLIAACSTAGWQGYPGFSMYSATKFAVRSLNQSAAKELGRHNITCNVYCPSPVDTQMWTDIDKTLSAQLGGQQGAITEARLKVTPMGRLVQATDVANLVSFLVGPDSNFISGESIVVSGADSVA
ncbi:acetoin reductase family protein [Cutaneotrichosporon oleaginosum]|uniref:Acetoin reductase family protein n=1 Tax=Cutaneotrichosporon oleaginosum TaxID=879819 RepID=A0A0J1B8Q7_9TREE|nr:acetoin reductase family protein [Cutaneotrichosporon oleaginosum]KLT44169.1 acetoin reductase family protein [Cutaneotrichosporon oleaginosum]